MTPYEIQNSIQVALDLKIKRTQEMAARFIERAQQEQKIMKVLLRVNNYNESKYEDNINSVQLVRGQQKETTNESEEKLVAITTSPQETEEPEKSSSNCDAAALK